jgi:hypothetical protein
VRLSDCDYEELTPRSTPTVTAEAVMKEFAADTSAAAKKYLDRDLIVRGTVVDLIATDGSFLAKLAGEGLFRVSCSMDEDEFKTLKKGDKVTIKGEAGIFNQNELTLVSAFLLPGKG